jgi:choline dehydrogenase-like flavoprotein
MMVSTRRIHRTYTPISGLAPARIIIRLGQQAMGTVVDSRLRVKGMKGLRCVDVSVIPVHISGNIVAPVYAIAEKVAGMMLEDAGAN